MESSNHLINNNISYVDKLNNLSKFLTKLNLKLPNTLFKNNLPKIHFLMAKLSRLGFKPNNNLKTVGRVKSFH